MEPFRTEASPRGLTAAAELARPSSPRRVAENAALLLAAQIVLKVAALGFNVYIVRRLGDAQFGRYTAALAYVGSVAMLTDLGTSSLSLREMARHETTISRLVPDLMAVRAVLSLLAMVCVPASAYLLGKPGDAVLAIALASTLLLLYAFCGPLDTALLARERFAYASALGLLNQTVFFALGTVMLATGHGYVGLLVASLGGVAAMGLASIVLIRRRLGWRFQPPDPRRWRALLGASLPFGVMRVVSTFSDNFDTVFLSFALTDAEVGWYNVPLTLATMALVPAQSIAHSLFPSLVRAHDGGRGSVRGAVQLTLRYFFVLAVPLAVGGVLLADRIIVVLYGDPFRPAVGVMRIMIWALPMMFLLELLGRTVTALHRERVTARVSVLNSLLGIGLIVLCIRAWGITGAAVAFVVNRLIAVATATLVVGPRLLWGGMLAPLAGVLGAAALMSTVLLAGDRALAYAPVGPVPQLLILVTGGALTYVLAALQLGAVAPREWRTLIDSVRSLLPVPARR